MPNHRHLRRAMRCLGLCLALSPVWAPVLMAQDVGGRLAVFNAGSLALPFRELLAAFRDQHPGITVAQESAGSLESARKLTELGKIPDVLGVADYGVIPALLVPRHAGWYATFARNAMVLMHTRHSIGAGDITTANWWQVLQRPGVRVGRSNPALDPAGYRALMAYQLAERSLGQPGLAARLAALSPPRYVRPKESDLTALVQAGELDYAWTYLSIARSLKMPFVALPPEVDLGDPNRADWYAQAGVRLPGATLSARDSITVRGAPIVYGLTVPRAAANPAAAYAFVRFMFSPAGRAILERTGLLPLPQPVFGGPDAPPPALRP